MIFVNLEIVTAFGDHQVFRLSMEDSPESDFSIEEVIQPEYDLVHLRLEHLLHRFIGGIAPFVHYKFNKTIYDYENLIAKIKEEFSND